MKRGRNGTGGNRENGEEIANFRSEISNGKTQEPAAPNAFGPRYKDA
jgi:hypothetical protein